MKNSTLRMRSSAGCATQFYLSLKLRRDRPGSRHGQRRRELSFPGPGQLVSRTAVRSRPAGKQRGLLDVSAAWPDEVE